MYILFSCQLSLKDPVLHIEAFGNRGFRTGVILVMLDFGITLSAMYLMPQFIQNGMGILVAFTGIILLPGGCMNAVFSLVSGRLFDRIGPKIPAVLGFGLAAAGGVLLLFTTKDTPVWYIILCHMILLIGVPLAMSTSQTQALSSLPPELSTDGSTILNTFQQVWGAVCTALATLLLGIGEKAFSGTDPRGSFTNGFHYGITFTLILALAGFCLAFTLKDTRKGSANGTSQ